MTDANTTPPAKTEAKIAFEERLLEAARKVLDEDAQRSKELSQLNATVAVAHERDQARREERKYEQLALEAKLRFGRFALLLVAALIVVLVKFDIVSGWLSPPMDMLSRSEALRKEIGAALKEADPVKKKEIEERVRTIGNELLRLVPDAPKSTGPAPSGTDGSYGVPAGSAPSHARTSL